MLRPILITTLVLSAISPTTVRAQQVDPFLGIGTARAGSSGRSIDTFGDGTLYATPALGGVFEDFDLNVLSVNRWVLDGQPPGGPPTTMPVFNTARRSTPSMSSIRRPDYAPGATHRKSAPAGIGFASVHFDFDDQQSCDQVTCFCDPRWTFTI